MSATTWTELETYRQLLQEFERRNADYQKRLEAYREAGEENPELKTQLEQEFSEIDSLYKRLNELRGEIARTRDAPPA